MGEIAVIGGGPAGSICALLLARGGRSVTLFEQHRFPRDKVCGECLSATGAAVLRRHGLFGALLDAGAVSLRRASLVGASGQRLELELPESMWGLSRAALDTLLLERARDAGAKVVQPARCEALHADGAVTWRDLSLNKMRHQRFSTILVADGKGALLPQRPGPTAILGIKAYFESVDCREDSISLFGLHGHYGGVAPVEGRRWNVAMAVPVERVRRAGGSLDALWENCLDESRWLRSAFRAARRIGPWLASPLPRFTVARHWPGVVIPVGNAAAALEPIGGEGMGLAMRSAELAANAILHVSDRCAPDSPHLRREYRALWNLRSLACRGFGMLLSSPAACEALLPLASESEPVRRAALLAIGK